MADVTVGQVSEPATPAAGKTVLWADSTDRRMMAKTDKGVRETLSGRELFNFIRNSGMWFAQWQPPGTLTTYSNIGGRIIGPDGWGSSNENASIQYRRVDTVGAAESGLQGRYWGEVTKITALGKATMCQVIEGSDCQTLRGRSVRFQVWLKAVIGTPITMKLGVLNWAGTIDAVPYIANGMFTAWGANGVDPTLAANFTWLAPKTGVTPDNAAAQTNNVTCAVTTTWQRFGFVVDVPTTCRNLIVVIHTDNQVIVTNGFGFSQASLTDGMEIQDWTPLSYGMELHRVQRFFCKSFSVDTGPVQNAGLGGSVRGSVAVAGAVAAPDIYIRYPVNMMAAPTLTYYNPSAANAFTRNVTAATDATATATGTGGDSGTDVSVTGIAAWTVAQSTALHYIANAEL